MEDLPPLGELLALIGVLYLVECVRPVGRASRVVRSLLPGRFRLVEPFAVSDGWKRAIVFGAPWPPLGALHVMDGLPVTVGPSGVSVPSTDGLHLRWEEAARRLRVDDLDLQVDGNPVAGFGTRRMSRAFAELLTLAAQATSLADRDVLLQQFFDRRFDVDEARARRSAWRRRGWPLVFHCNLLFVAIFGGWLAALGLGVRWELVLAWVVLTWLPCVGSFWLTQRALLPRPVRPPAWRRWVTTASPLSLVRAADEVRAELWGELDPLAAASIVVPSRELVPALRRALAELEWPLPSAAVGAAQVDAQWMRAALRERLERLCRAHGVDPVALLHEAPVADSPEGAFCPRCLTQFTSVDASCAECPGVPLRSFAPEPALQR
jgi:hypothetical protein